MNVKDLITECLRQSRVMQLATCADEQPWCCTVHFAIDDDYNFYWISTPARRHSGEIAGNPKVAAAIALPQTGGGPRGVQLQGMAREITDPAEIAKLIVPYEEKLGRQGVGAAIIDGSNPHRLYQLKPSKIKLFDTVNFPKSPEQEWTPGAEPGLV